MPRRRGLLVATLGVVAATAMLVAGAPALGAAPSAVAPAGAPGAQLLVPTGLQDFTFQSLDVDYTLTKAEDGTSRLRVIETFVAQFPEFDQNRGMQRRIPDSWLDVPTYPTLVSVTDENGDPRPAETESEDGHLIVTARADDFVHGAQTYVFTYDMQNVVRFFDDTGVEEFYWDVNGVDWAQPFASVTARLHVDGAPAAALTGSMACYWGYQGDTGQTCAIERVDAAASGALITASQAELGPYQTVTIAVAFEPGAFTPFDSSYLASPWGWLQGIAAALGIGGLLAGLVVRARRLRDDPGRPTIIAEYTPPAEVDALESAVLLGKTTKAIPAEVLEQAVIGSIRIVEAPRSFWGGQKYELHLVDASRADADGTALLRGMFGWVGNSPRAVFELGKSDSRLSTTAQRILKDAESELARKGLRRAVPMRYRVWPALIALAGAALVFLTGFAALNDGVNAWIPLGLMVTAPLLVVITFGLVARKPLTAHGAEVRDHLKGLEVFIDWAEADRIRMLQSPQGAERRPIAVDDTRQLLVIYEKLLPFAVVFGQERKWAEQLTVYYGDRAPGWYYGSGSFNAAAFSSSISSLSSSTSASASTSGGSGGGGSSGGGGGGGGGGGV